MPFTSANFFIDALLFSKPQLVVIDKNTGARSGADYRTVTIGFYYDGGTGVDAADGYNVDWLGVTTGGTRRGLFGGEPVPSVHDFNPASPHAGTPGLDANGNLPAGAIEVNGERYWLGSFQATVPSGQVEETTYHGELQLIIQTQEA